MELSLSHTLYLFNIFREYDGKDNCAQYEFLEYP
ncbi:hypothetical protein T12_14117 [Trichinella patagoniensis]|uniref:Uncharacterized protein n=1 Tax=Trichinella patagoniensis TaxID=990121 RepID=A0A0V0Y088_9BILA|nr:hypothetical protein T12_14117 [Trichinella patagoniensis]